jgi:hypothetical protein
LVAHLYNEHGTNLGTMPLTQVDPADLVALDTELAAPAKSFRISIHLEDSNGLDRGALQEVQVGGPENH